MLLMDVDGKLAQQNENLPSTSINNEWLLSGNQTWFAEKSAIKKKTQGEFPLSHV